MNDLVAFAFDGLPFRVIDRDGNHWFVATDVCAILGLSQVSRAVNRLDEDERGLLEVTVENGLRGAGGSRITNIISESGLYTLILRSDKPQAKPFRRWVTHEVLPSIRKTGKYEILTLRARRMLGSKPIIYDTTGTGFLCPHADNPLIPKCHKKCRGNKSKTVCYGHLLLSNGNNYLQ